MPMESDFLVGPEEQPEKAVDGDAMEIERIEIRLLLEAIYMRYGYDFREYSMASLRRRIRRRLTLDGTPSVSVLMHTVLMDKAAMGRLLDDLSIHVTEMFRDPAFFQAIRKHVAPVLRTYPFIRVWHAGCSTGEEAYSMAIVLHEEHLLERTRIYATDFNEAVLRKAREGVIAADRLREYTANYQQSGGTESFADYYTARYGFARIAPELQRNIVFAAHNLATDGVFGEMHLVLCRNVLIYFAKELHAKVLALFADSLCHRGFLCLGMREGLRKCLEAGSFEEFMREVRIYRKRSGEHG